MDQPGRLWLLCFVLPIRHGRPLTAVMVGLPIAVVFSTTGLFASGESSSAIFFCVVLAYIVPVFHFITERTVAALQALYPVLRVQPDEMFAWEASIVGKTMQWQLMMGGIGVACYVVHAWLLAGSFSAWFAAVARGPAELAFTLVMALVWIVLTLVIAALLDNAKLFARLANRADIPLLNIHKLTPFARIAVISTLSLIGAQAAFSIMWIDDTPLLTFAPGLIATAIPMLILFLRPVIPVHRAIVSAKSSELDRLNGLVETLSEADPADSETLERRY